ncbi:MAG: hypothetical protein ACOYL6_17225 [Bacteriovoracaceae bacterium]
MARRKKKDSNIDFGSYSDLFMVMSFVFLFMYVVSTINTGVSIIQERSKASATRKKLEKTVAKYERKVEAELPPEEIQQFDELKASLAKLREDAKANREYQEKMAKLAAEKEQEMQVYEEAVQRMMVDKAKSAELIKEKDRSIASLKEDLDTKSKVLESKAQEIEKRTLEIAFIEERVNELKSKEMLAASQSKELKELTKTLQTKEQDLTQAKTKLNDLQKEKESLYKASIVQVNRINREKEALARTSIGELQKLQAENEQIKAQSEEEKNKLTALKDSEIEQFKKAKEEELAKLHKKYIKDSENIRKEIALSLANKLKKSGLDASVNPTSGDVTVHFKNGYFEYNSSMLKEAMKEEIKVIFPLYAKTLFENKKFAGAISSVEIVGSSSPSFKGKYVDPRKMASVDEQKAMTYNLDLSYRRAKGIFEYSFLGNELDFEHKKEMVHLVKVSGTGYLQAMDDLVQLEKSAQNEKQGFCGIYNCDVYQKVTLRFTLKEKQENQ